VWHMARDEDGEMHTSPSAPVSYGIAIPGPSSDYQQETAASATLWSRWPYHGSTW
jgi:hypothetical protein